MLYDKKFVDSLPDAFHFENPWVVGICTYDHNKKLRALIEKWYAELPDDMKPDFYKKLRSLNNTDMIPAFYELMVYRYCIEEGWKVEHEQPLESGKTPDFVITTKSGYRFVIEVASLFDSQDILDASKKKREFTEKVSKLNTHHILELQYDSLPTHDAKPGVALRRVKDWLKDVPDDGERHMCGFGATGTGYHFQITVNDKLPKPSEGCLFSVGDGAGSVPNYSDRIKGIFDKKRKLYSSKKTGLPLVVVITDAIGFLRGDVETIDRALYGQMTITFGLGSTGDPVAGRDRSGYFTPSNDEDGSWKGKNEGVSAIIYAAIKENATFSIQLFNNPFPHMELDMNIFRKMPQLMPWVTPEKLEMRWVVENPQESRIFFDEE